MPIELVTTDGVFELDGGSWEVTNNIWLVGDDREVVVFDAAHNHEPIVGAVSGRRVRAIVLTHGHNDHINAAVPLRDAVDAPVLLHPADRMLWDVVWPADVSRRRCRAEHLDRCRRTRPPSGPHAGPLPRLLLLPRRRHRRRLHRRHVVLRRSRARPAGATATNPRSCDRSSPRSCRSPTTRSCTPATANRPRSAPNATASSPAPPNSACNTRTVCFRWPRRVI